MQQRASVVRTAEGGDIEHRISESITCRGYQRVADLGRIKMDERVSHVTGVRVRQNEQGVGYLLSEISRNESMKSPAHP